MIGDEQVDAALCLSDDVAGDNWQPGVRKEGTIHWESRQPFDQLVQLGTLRFVGDAPFPTEDFEQVGDNFEIIVECQP